MSTPALPFVRDRRFAFDFVLCCAVTLVGFVSLRFHGSSPEAILLDLLITLPLMVRRMFPAAALAVCVAGALGGLVVEPRVSVAGLIAAPIMIYSLARWNSPRLARFGLAAGLAGALLGPLRWFLRADQLSLALVGVSVVACTSVVGGAYLLGRRVQESSTSSVQQQQAQAERIRLVEAEQEQRDRAATIDERNRIARELHDIVAHSLSVIVVQAEGGRALAAKRPEQAVEVLGTIAETGREALGEMRRIVGVLRSDVSEAPELQPAAGLDDIGELVRKTGDRFELRTFGETPAVSAALGLTAYRVVQESLTNVLKHAGPTARARVTVAYTGSAVEIEVGDDGWGQDAPDDRSGHGLQGMAERVALQGGELSAAPGPAGGWVVRARLPFDPARALQVAAHGIGAGRP